MRDYPDVVRVFIHAPREYRINKVSEMYGDSSKEAADSIKRSDEARAVYYKNISDLECGYAKNYDLCIDSSIGAVNTAKAIYEYIRCKSGTANIK